MTPQRPATVSAAILIATGAEHERSSPGLLPVLGMPILEWQVRAVRSVGIGRILLLSDVLPEPLATRLADGVTLERLAHPADLPPRLSGTILLLAEGIIIDRRALNAFMSEATAPALIQFGMEPPPGVERIDRDSHWAGAALLPAAMITRTVADLGDWSLESTLLRVSDAAGAQRFALETLDPGEPEDKDRRLASPLSWAMPRDAEAANTVGRNFIAASVPLGPDLADRTIYWPLAQRLAAPLAGLTWGGSWLRWSSLLMAALALPAFLLHYWWGGLGLLLLAPLAEQTGRIVMAARSEVASRHMAGEGVRTVLAAVALVGLALSLPPGPGMAAALAGATLLYLTALRVVRLSWYRRRMGQHLDMRGRTDERVIGLMGPATSLALPLLPFAAVGLWWPGLVLLAVWSALLFLLLEWRFLVAMDTNLPPSHP